MTQLPTRQQIERAETLDFPQRTKADLTITVKATIDGFPTEVCFTGSIDQLLNVTKRLRELGAAPMIAPAAHTAPLNTPRKPAQTVEPVYQPDGTACCPVHRKPLSEGRYGLFCPSKAKPGEEQNDKGYCSLKFAE
jgi:hypothetical protein